MFAVAAIELFREAYPDKGAPLEWLLEPHRRHTLLTELGRTAKPRSDAAGGLTWSEEDVSELIRVALEIAAAASRRRSAESRVFEHSGSTECRPVHPIGS